MSEITRNPLCWPDNVARTAPQRRGYPGFKLRTLSEAASFVLAEINRINNRRWDFDDDSVIISSNLRLKTDGTPYSQQGEPADTGIAVYFTLRIWRNGKIIERPIVMSCDRWIKTADNLYAIGKDIEAQRARTRWGCTNYEQSFRGYMAIPEHCGGPSWWDTLGISASATREVIESAYKQKAKTLHPDRGGTSDQFSRLKQAFDQAMSQFNG
jgi:hypothetical protein